MKFALKIALGVAMAALAAPAAMAQEPIEPPQGIEPKPWPAPPQSGTFDIAFQVRIITGRGVRICAPTNLIARGERAVWHIGAINARTGKYVMPKDVKYAYLKLPGIKNIKITFVPHGRDPNIGPWTWTARWDIPMDYPLGAVPYTIVFKLKGWPRNKVATFTEIPLAGETVTVVEKRT